MTEKRFMIDDAGTLIDMESRDTYDYVSDVVDLLNGFVEEEKYLKFKGKQQRETIKMLLKENEQLKQANERICDDIDLALGFIRHKGYSLQDIKDYEDAKKEYEEDLKEFRKGDVE